MAGWREGEVGAVSESRMGRCKGTRVVWSLLLYDTIEMIEMIDDRLKEAKIESCF